MPLAPRTDATARHVSLLTVSHSAHQPALASISSALPVLALPRTLVLQQVEEELNEVSMTFARLHGRGELALDLYGRGSTVSAPPGTDQHDAQLGRQLSSGKRRSRIRCDSRLCRCSPVDPVLPRSR